MSDSTTSTSTTESGQQSVQATQTTATPDVNSLPDWAREAITKANNEAAQYRVDRNNARDAAKTELQAEFDQKLADANAATDEAKTTISARELDIIKLKAALLQLHPDSAPKVESFAGLLQGADEAEIVSHAEKVKELFGNGGSSAATTSAAVDHTQGHGSTIPLNGDPILAALKARVGA